MHTEQLDENAKTVVIEIADICYEMDIDELPEEPDMEKEREVHVNVICKQIEQARKQGYTKYVLWNREEAEERGQDLGINGIYLLVARK